MNIILKINFVFFTALSLLVAASVLPDSGNELVVLAPQTVSQNESTQMRPLPLTNRTKSRRIKTTTTTLPPTTTTELSEDESENVNLTASSVDAVPPMIDIPLGLEDIKDMSEYLSHTGLQLALESLQNKKSSRNVYILLLGLGGSGKSSAINSLFGQQLAPVEVADEADSTSPFITEYITDIALPEFGIQNSQLHIIDTPELGSSKGLSTDAAVITAMHSFLSNHSELNTVLPNLVLIFSSFNDNGFQDASSNFVKILSRYEVFKDKFTGGTISNEYSASNIIFVLSKFTSETKNNISSKLELFRSTIKNFTNYPSPFDLVVTENVVEENEAIQSDANGNYLPPNKEPCPPSLIEQMLITCNRSSDQLCYKMLAKIKTLKNRRILQFKSETSPAINRNDSNIQTVLDLWSADEFSRGIVPTEVSKMLELTYNTILDVDLKQNYPGSLQLLQRVFHSRNVTAKSQVQTSEKDIVAFLENVDMNPAMLALLQTTFPLFIPEISFDPLVGRGYDPTTDSPTESPFNFGELEYSKLGFMIPRSVTMQPCIGNEQNVIHFHPDFKSYVMSRVNELNLADQLNETNFKGEFRIGETIFNLIRIGSAIKLTGIREIRQFQFTLNNNFEFKEEFVDYLSDLPPYNVHERDSVNEWRSLLYEYGTHVISSAYGGGYLTATVEIRNQELTRFRSGNTTAVQRILELALENPAQFVNSNPTDFSITVMLNNVQSEHKGVNLLKMNSTSISEIYTEWKNTLSFQAIMLQTKLKLVPLSEYIRPVNATVASEFEKATQAWFEGTLEYVPPPKAPSIGSAQSKVGIGFNQNLQLAQKPLDESVTRMKPLSASTPKSTLPTKEDLDANNLLLTCLQMFIESLDAQIQKSSDPVLMELANNIEAIYNKVANTGAAKASEKTMIEVTCRNYSKTSPPPIERLKSLANLDLEDLYQSTMIPIDDFPEVHQPSSNLDQLARMAKSVLDNTISYSQRAQVTDYKFIGYGYDVLWDRVLSSSPFLLTENSFVQTPLKSHSTPRHVFEYFSGRSEYIKLRLKALTSTSGLQITSANFKGNTKPGHASNNDDFISILYEFKNSLVKLKSVDQLSLSEAFKSDLTSLPSFDLKNCNSTNSWRRFLNRYGTQVVREASIGGAIEIKAMKKLKSDILKIRKNVTALTALLNSGKFKHQNFTFRVLGGNSSIFTSSNRLSLAQLAQWIPSIAQNPVLLPVNVRLKSLQKIISTIEPTIAIRFIEASNAYFNGDLKACDTEIRCGPFQDYNSVTHKCECASGLGVSSTDGTCEILAGSNCSMSTWHTCVWNADCKMVDNQPTCTCNEDFAQTPSRKCIAPIRGSCQIQNDCDLNLSMRCVSGRCECADLNSQRHNASSKGCYSLVGKRCGRTNIDSFSFTLACSDQTVCDHETKICVRK